MESFLRMSSSSSSQAQAEAQGDSQGDSQDGSIPKTTVTSNNTSQDCNKSAFIKWQVSTELGRDGNEFLGSFLYRLRQRNHVYLGGTVRGKLFQNIF